MSDVVFCLVEWILSLYSIGTPTVAPQMVRMLRERRTVDKTVREQAMRVIT